MWRRPSFEWSPSAGMSSKRSRGRKADSAGPGYGEGVAFRARWACRCCLTWARCFEVHPVEVCCYRTVDSILLLLERCRESTSYYSTHVVGCLVASEAVWRWKVFLGGNIFITPTYLILYGFVRPFGNFYVARTRRQNNAVLLLLYRNDGL